MKTLTLFVALSAAITPRLADACGGCFSPPDTVTAVDSHRMVISLGTERTILWDQIEYSGRPADFVWVLPVPTPEAKVELAEAAFFDDLDARTSPGVLPANPLSPVYCATSASVGCGAASASSDQAFAGLDGGNPPVTVYGHDVVGPYETVTVGSEDEHALYAWLNGHGYRVPDETLPTLSYYVDQKSVFVVLRLQPGENVSAMQPVRITYPGFMGTFPLKMVTVGAAGVLGMTLWVIAEQRYEARNYGTVEIDPADLTWDWSAGKSDYPEVFDATIARSGGRAWVVEQASPLSSVPLLLGADLDAATQAIPYPYLTRLRTRVLIDNIDEDLELAPSAQTADVGTTLIAEREANRPEAPKCDEGPNGCATGRRGAALAPGLLGLVGLALLRLRRARNG